MKAGVRGAIDSERTRDYLAKLAPLKDSIGSVAARGLVLPLTGLATVLSSRIVVEATGTVGFAWFSLLITLPLLIPISDFGIASVLTDVIARHGTSSQVFRDVARRAIFWLCLIASAAISGGAVLALNGLWSQILGLPSGVGTELACLALTTSMAIGIPLGAGQRILLGLGKQSTSTVILGAGGLISLGLVWFLHTSDHDNFGAYGVAYSLGPLAAQGCVAAVAWRMATRGPVEAPSITSVPIVRISTVAVPMAIIAIALPLAYQSDRVVLAHFASANEVAAYSLVAILYGPLLSIIAVGGQALWPLFLGRSQLEARRLIYRQATILFCALGIVLAAGLIFVGPVISSFVASSNGRDKVQISTFVLFGLLLLMFAAHTTNGMLLMDDIGRRVQAAGSVALLFVKVPISILLVPSLGANGVIIATLLAAIPCLVLPALVLARRRLRRVPPGRFGSDLQD